MQLGDKRGEREFPLFGRRQIFHRYRAARTLVLAENARETRAARGSGLHLRLHALSPQIHLRDDAVPSEHVHKLQDIAPRRVVQSHSEYIH